MDNKHEVSLYQQDNKGEIILYQPDNSLKLDVWLEDETVWLSQAQMAELFQTTRNNVTIHIINIFREGELERIRVCKDFLHTTQHGAISGKIQKKSLNSILICKDTTLNTRLFPFRYLPVHMTVFFSLTMMCTISAHR